MKKLSNFNVRSRSIFGMVIGAACFFALLSCGAFNSNNSEDIRVLMVGGGSSHDFEQWYKGSDVRTLENSGKAEVIYTDSTDSIAFYLSETDVLYLSNNQPIGDPSVRQAIMDFVDAGNGLILGHAALWYNWSDWPEYNRELVSGGSRGHDAYGSFQVSITDTDHPITQGVESEFTLKDELYYFQPDSKGPGIQILATASAAGSNDTFPSIFTVNHDEGRIVGIALGHDAESHEIPSYKTLLLNAVQWAANN